ncbi:unnamed protein product, partial [Didymodactylos carnosus]
RKNNYELTKFVDFKKCQLAVLTAAVKRQQKGHVNLRYGNGTIRSADSEHSTVTKLESPVPMTNTSVLRQELHDACGIWPIYWTESVHDDELQTLINEQKIIEQDGSLLKAVNGGRVKQNCVPLTVSTPG